MTQETSKDLELNSQKLNMKNIHWTLNNKKWRNFLQSNDKLKKDKESR